MAKKKGLTTSEWSSNLVAVIAILSAIITAISCVLSFDKADAIFAQKIETLFDSQLETKNSLTTINTKLDGLNTEVVKLQTQIDMEKQRE